MAKTSSDGKVTVPVNQLEVGMFVTDVGRSWINHPWQSKSKRIESKADIQRLVEFGIEEVEVDPARSAPSPGQASPDPLPESSNDESAAQADDQGIEQIERRRFHHHAGAGRQAFSRALIETQPIHRESIDLVRRMLMDVQNGENLDLARIKSHLIQMAHQVSQHWEAVFTWAKLNTYAEYQYTHPLNVALFAMRLGHVMGFEPETIEQLGLGGLLHDVGMVFLPEELLNKPGRLTPEEFETIKTHPERGAKFLERQPLLPPDVLGMVRHHHERVDGLGYPDGLTEERLEPAWIVIGLADFYDAVTAARPYRNGWLTHQGLKMLFKIRGTQFPAPYVDHFIRSLGLYPLGSMVRLDTGETAVVVEVHTDDLTRPAVQIVSDRYGRPLGKPKRVDLRDQGDLVRRITGALDHRRVNINPLDFFPMPPSSSEDGNRLRTINYLSEDAYLT